jgi:hypothetical protein
VLAATVVVVASIGGAVEGTSVLAAVPGCNDEPDSVELHDASTPSAPHISTVRHRMSTPLAASSEADGSGEWTEPLVNTVCAVELT